MTDQPKPILRPRRRFLRFSVRGMIVLVLVVGGWLGWIVRSARIQRDAVAAITKTGGSVNYDWEWSDGGPVPGGQPWAPRWIVKLIGVDYFGHITSVSYSSGALDRVRARVAEMGEKLAALRAKLDGIDDGKIATREQRQKLLESTMIDGKTVLAKLEEAKQLSHREYKFTDDELAPLKWLTKLSDLDLSNTAVSDAGLGHIEGLIKLERLDLSSTPITDAGLARLKGMTKLRSLDLGWTRVTDAGLAHLTGMSTLTHLDVSGTRVTRDGKRELEQARPNLNVYNWSPRRAHYARSSQSRLTSLAKIPALQRAGDDPRCAARGWMPWLVRAERTDSARGSGGD